ncbi:alpha/beta fold hydrolase [Salinicola peritrichatus]|uniref:alpha/beta fold hydrolase n=1 Tax=Salinicola peritrichatus TaxID=1267424 RepID=UPI00195513BA|nr:alpha/beta fold hydrolase [Salinicola peritrichatus]
MSNTMFVSSTMRDATREPTLILLPGWALGPAPLAPLVVALRCRLPEWRVECVAYPESTSHRPESWVARLDQALPQGTWLAGWSLGGMLAAALARWRGGQARGLITLGANASFVVRPDWPGAMAKETFTAFGDGLRLGPRRALTRFAQLTAQGGRDSRRLSRELLTALETTPLDQALAGLSILAELDLRDTLERLRMPQLHLFADNDLLIPAAARAAMAECLPVGGRTECLEGVGHAFPLERAEETAERMAAFIHASEATAERPT